MIHHMPFLTSPSSWSVSDPTPCRQDGLTRREVMSGRKLFSRTQKRGSEGGSKAAVRYTPCSRQELRLEDELDDIAVVSNAEPGQVRYGSGAVTANGPKVVPGEPP